MHLVLESALITWLLKDISKEFISPICVVNSATVAQEYAKFWVGIESPVVNVVSRNVPIQPSNSITTRRPAFKPPTPNYVPVNNDQQVS